MTVPEGERAAESFEESLGGLAVKSMVCADDTGLRLYAIGSSGSSSGAAQCLGGLMESMV
eukprot:CAMPEP_0204627698 /NCGR_PEP_ID=MMETSP0717-20131115/14204_1 /ASSEMBLY_ACC=CAM_ASM_000666 /TAXON_ID=230516 /ORGANISM="Chaetoceros curvisetus" /LENGTH=59 /DNA_ID=CAMNT_0051644041 /DNA_START=14 /DNA_END=193 /DNA_ORIENTATION=-